MPCGGCGAAVPAGARFCPQCGRPQEAACPGCGAAAPAGAKFCHHCGHRLAAVAAAPAAAPDVVAEGENRVVTVLFADMVGSVSATGRLEAEAAADLVNRLLAAMAEAVQRYGGRVDRFLGDGVLATFGAERAHEDDPERALLAAVDVREAAQRLGFAVSAGVNTGEVYFGRVGSAAHRETTVMGPAVNLAARLQGQAGAGRILAGDATRRLARGAFEFKPVDVRIKGLDGDVRAWEVVRAAPRGVKARGLEGVRTELVGREDERARLRRALAETRAGRGQVVTLVGDAGVGKSRLLAELRRDADAARVHWVEGRGLELASRTSYGPFVDLFREQFGWTANQNDRAQAERILARLRALAEAGALPPETLDDAAAALARLLAVPLGPPWDARLAAATPEQVRNRTFVAIGDYLRALGRRGPVVLVLEDLHWADALTLGLVPVLLEALAEAPILVVLTYRPEREHGCWRLAEIAARKCPGRHTDVHLRELAPEEGRRLVRALLGGRSTEAVETLVLERAQGNPLFVEEVVRSLADAGLGGATAVPESVQAVILSRVDGLDEPARAALQCASVFGRLFSPDLLRRVAPAGLDVRGALRVLEERGLVYLERAFPEEQWSFKHALTQETVYRSLVRPRRVALHRRAAEAIEVHFPPDSLDQHYESLAHHYETGDDAPKAVVYALKAGLKAKAAFLNDAAAAYFRRGLERVAEMPAEARSAEVAVALREGLGDVLVLTGQPAEGLAHLDAALAEVPPDDVLSRGRLHRKRAVAIFRARRYPEAVAAFAESERVLGGDPETMDAERRAEWIENQVDRAWVLYWTNDVEGLATLLARAEDPIRRHGTPAQQARYDFGRAMHRLRVGRYTFDDELMAIYATMAKHAAASAVPEVVAENAFGNGFAYLFHGDLDEAAAELERGLELTRRLGERTVQLRCLVYLGVLERMRGDAAKARAWAQLSLEAAEAAGSAEYRAASQANLAWVAWKEGRRDEARALARLAVDVFGNPVPAYAFKWLALAVLLDLDAADGDLASAARWARELVHPLHQRLPEELEAALRAGADAAEAGRVAEARAAFARAVELHRALRHL